MTYIIKFNVSNFNFYVKLSRCGTNYFLWMFSMDVTLGSNPPKET